MIKRSKKIIGSLLMSLTLVSVLPCTQTFATSKDKVLIKVVNIDGKQNTQYIINGEILRNQWYEYDVPLASIDKDGKEIQFNDHRKVYLDENGCPLTGLQVIDGDTYYFGGGTMKTGAITIKGSSGKREKYLFGSDGKRITDPTKVKYTDEEYAVSDDGSVTMTVDGITYNVPKDQAMADDNILEKDGKNYMFFIDIYGKVYKDGNPHIAKSSRQGEYYAKEDGTLAVNEWAKDERNFWHYYGVDFKSVKGYQTIDGKKYYFNKYGILSEGWKRRTPDEDVTANYKDKELYYFGEDGAIKEGWVNYNGKWYYIYSNGLVATDTTIDGYYVNKSGVWVK